MGGRASGSTEDRSPEELLTPLAPKDGAKRFLATEIGFEILDRDPASKTDCALRLKIEGPKRRLAKILREKRECVRMGCGDMENASDRRFR